jgi:hypothetical protein
VTLPSITPLTSKKDFDNWITIVEAALETKQMGNLINSNLPRPSEEDPDYDRWVTASQLVKFWLLHLCSEIMTEIRHSGNKYPFADDLMQILKLEIRRFRSRLEATRRSWPDSMESTMTEGHLQMSGEVVDQEPTYKKTENNGQDIQGGKPQKKAIRNAPGKGEDIERHVVTLRNRQSKDGSCAYCTRPRHRP